MPKVNLDEVQAFGGDYLRPGFHPVKVEEVEETTSQAGNPMFVLTMRAIGGDQEGATIRDRLVFTPKALGWVKSFCAAAGIPMEGDFDLTPEMVEGCKLKIIVREESYTASDGTLKTGSKVQAHEEYDWQNEADVPADTNGLPVGAAANVSDDDIPF
jgi:hypothetical protein